MSAVDRAGDHTSDVESVEDEEIITTGVKRGFENNLSNNELLSALRRSAAAVETMASAPPVVKRRVRALKTLQLQVANLEAEFYNEVHKLECKYAKMYQPLFDKRAEIVNAKYEPTDAECVNAWHEDSDDEDLVKGVKAVNVNEEKKEQLKTDEKKDEDVKGIPEFWLTIFRNVSMLADMLQEHDEPIIEKLVDIKVKVNEDPMGFILEFIFAPNEYFTNGVLTKEYLMKCKPDDESPLDFEGPEIYSCKGCEINWNKGKNVTVKTIKKKQKHKSRGSVRTVSKSVQADSFFNFFNPPAMPEDPDSNLISDVQALLTTDFEIGHYIRERVVPRAVLLYTGEGLDEDDDDYEDDEEEEEECSSEEESSDENSKPVNRKQQRRVGGNKTSGKHTVDPNECKQQ